MFISVRCQVGFQALGKFTAGEQNAPSASFAFEADIGAKAGNGPFIGAARVLFAETQVVVKTQVGKHGCRNEI